MLHFRAKDPKVVPLALRTTWMIVCWRSLSSEFSRH
jgi:hypothetical protein